MTIQKHTLYRLGHRGHVVLVVDSDDLTATYRVVRSSESVKSDAFGREKTVTTRNLVRQLDTGVGGVVHLCPRCYGDEVVDRVLYLLSTGHALSGKAECNVCGGDGTVGFAQEVMGIGAATYRLTEIDRRAGRAMVVDSDGNRYLPAWVTGPYWTAREWAKLLDSGLNGAAAPPSVLMSIQEARLNAIRAEVARARDDGLRGQPSLNRIGALAAGELDHELGAAR